jgi:hypothetical protein
MSTSRTAILIATAIVGVGCNGGPSDPVLPPPPPPITYSASISYQLDGAGAPVPNSMLYAECLVKDSKGNSVSDSCTWKLDGAIVGSSATLQLQITPGAHSLCLAASKVQGDVCVSLSVTASSVSYTASITNVSFALTASSYPLTAMYAEGNGVDSRGQQQSTGYKWTLDGAEIGTSSSVSRMLSQGTYQLCLSVNSSERVCDEIVVDPTPVFRGGVFPVSPLGGVVSFNRTVCARWAQDSTCVTTNPLGGFLIETPLTLGDSVLLYVPSSSDLMASVATVARVDFARNHNFSVPVRNWRISSGMWNGTTVPLSLEKAYKKTEDGVFSFFTFSSVNGGKTTYYSLAWDILPINVALDREESNVTLDSAQRFSVIAGINHQLGIEMFRPATLGIEIVKKRWPDGSPYYEGGIGIYQRVGPETHGASPIANPIGLIGFTVKLGWSANTDQVVEDFKVAHELGHAIGFGHTPRTSWFPGVMTNYQSPNEAGNLFGLFIPEEVAHIQMYYALRKSQLLQGGYGLPQVVQGDRMARSLPRESIYENPFWPGVSMSAVNTKK